MTDPTRLADTRVVSDGALGRLPGLASIRTVAAAGLLAASTLVALPHPASADVITVSYTGTVAIGYSDPGNYFGGGDLSGDSITVTMTYNTASLTYNNSPGSLDDLLASSSSGSMSASVTINGYTQSANNNSTSDGAEIVAQAGNPEDVTFDPDESGANTIDLSLFTKGQGGAGWVDGALLTSNPFGQLATYGYDTGGYRQTAYVQFGSGALDTISFYETAAQETPEPASLALIGTGLAGLTWLRRRKRA